MHGAPAHRSVSFLNASLTDAVVFAVVLTPYTVNFRPRCDPTLESAALIQ